MVNGLNVTMLNHLVHRTFLQELTFGITVLTIVIIDTAIYVCAAVFIPRKWHTAARL